jgi:hypothetical protein
MLSSHVLVWPLTSKNEQNGEMFSDLSFKPISLFRSALFSDVTPCKPAEVYGLSGEIYYFHLLHRREPRTQQAETVYVTVTLPQ